MQSKNPKPKLSLSPEEIKNRIENDPSFVLVKRFDYSIDKLVKRYPHSCPDHIAAQALDLDIEVLQERYIQIVGKLRLGMGVE